MLDTIELSKKLISFDSVTPAKQDIFDFLIKIFKEQDLQLNNLILMAMEVMKLSI